MSESRLLPEGEAWEIVRELAERGPFEGNMSNCTFCHLIQVQVDLDDPDDTGPDASNIAHHYPDCLWRRARELHPKAAE